MTVLKTTLVLLALGLGATDAQPSPQPPTAAEAAEAQLDAISQVLSLTSLPVAVDVVWLPCGEENAFYSPGEQTIVMCLELQADPGSTAIAAHEAGHALVDQLGLGIDADPQANERAADELAAVALLEAGEPDLVVAAAKTHMRWAQEMGVGDEDGVHPKLMDRAYEELCLVDGATGGSPQCQGLYQMVRTRWLAEIAAAEMHVFAPKG